MGDKVSTYLNIPLERLENLFEVGTDSDGRLFVNLTESLKFSGKIPAESLGTFQVRYKMSWHNISYDIYGTMDYWWCLPILNKRLAINLPNPGENLIYLNKDSMRNIVEQIQEN